MSLWKRVVNLWFLSEISKEDIQKNPHSFALHHANKQDIKGKAYIIGLSDEEQSYAETLNANGKDTLIT